MCRCPDLAPTREPVLVFFYVSSNPCFGYRCHPSVILWDWITTLPRLSQLGLELWDLPIAASAPRVWTAAVAAAAAVAARARSVA